MEWSKIDREFGEVIANQDRFFAINPSENELERSFLL
jgi:hypothetical protein